MNILYQLSIGDRRGQGILLLLPAQRQKGKLGIPNAIDDVIRRERFDGKAKLNCLIRDQNFGSNHPGLVS